MNRLRQLRVERHITQEELAHQLKTSQQQVSKIERYMVPMNEKMIKACVDFFGVTADYLLGISDVQVEIGIGITEPDGGMNVEMRELLYYYESLDPERRKLFRRIAKVVADMNHK